MTSSLRILAAPFKFDLGTVAIENGDFDLGEAGKIVGLPRVTQAAIDLYKQAGAPPTVCFGADIGHLRAVAAHLRIAEFRAVDLDDFVDVETCRARVAELCAGQLDVLVTSRRLMGAAPIPRLGAIILLRPTLNSATHMRCLSRLDRGLDNLVIVDVVRGCAQHGTWPDVSPEVIVGDAPEIITDPALTQLCGMPHRAALQWAGSNTYRIELVRRAKGHRPGWSYHVIQAVRGKAAAQEWWERQQQQKSGTTGRNRCSADQARAPP